MPKRALLFAALISLLYCVSLVQDTYAKYVSSASSEAELTIARWKINVNDFDIVNSSSFENMITPVFKDNDNIEDDVIAPTAEGYFDIDLDATDTQVSLTYNVTAEPATDSPVVDLVIYAYEINSDGIIHTISETSTQISGNILYDDTEKEVSVRYYVRWIDDSSEGAIMDNQNDTQATLEDIATLNVTINVIQLNSNAGNDTNETI